MANRINFQIGYEINKSKLEEIKKSLRSIQDLTTKDITKLDKSLGTEEARDQLRKVKDTGREVSEALKKSFSSSLGVLNIEKFSQELKNIGIDKIYNDFSKAGVTGQAAFRNIATQAMTTNKQIKETNKLLDNMASSFKNAITWSISSSAINAFTGSFEKAYGYVKNLDRSLNDIRIVTGRSAEDMSKFAVEANKAAQELGAKTVDYTDAALIYYQQGLSDAETKVRSDITLKAANVTQQASADVSEQLTAVWNGYKVNAAEAELYVDKLAGVAAATASDLEELSVGMSKVASAANLMGVDVDQLNAMLSTIISVTREAPESVGTALKSIFTRMSGIESGEDGELSLKQYSQAMADMGVQVLNAEGHLRGMGDVVEEIGAKWKTMSKDEQVALAQTVGGTYQYSRVLALFDNFDEYNRALQISQESIGTLQEQQDIYMEGTQAHLAKLKAASEDLYDSMFNAGTVNTFADALTGVIRLMTNLVDSVGGGANTLLTLGSIGTRVFSQQIAQGISGTINNMRKMQENAKQLSAQMQIQQMFKDTHVQDEALKKLVEMKETMIEYNKYMSQEQEEQANMMLKTTNELQNQKAAWEENIKAVEDYLNTRREANQGEVKLSGGIQKDSTEETDYLGTIGIIKEYAEQGTETLYEYEKSLKSVTKAQNDLQKAQNVVDNKRSAIDRIREKMEELEQATESTEEQIAEYSRLSELLTEATGELESAEINLERQHIKQNQTYNKLKEQTESYIDQIKELAKAEGVLTQEQRDSLQNALQEFEDSISDTTSLEDYQKVLEELMQTYNNLSITLDTDATQMGDILQQLINGDFQNLQDDINTLNDSWEDFTGGLVTTAHIETVTELAGSIGQVVSAGLTLKNVFDTINDTELTSLEKAQSVVSSLLISIPMLVTGLKGAREGLIGLANIAGLAGAAGEITTLGGALSGLFGVITANIAVILPIVAVIAGLGVGLYALVKKFNAVSDAAKEAAEEAKKVNEIYQELKESYNNFKETQKGYNDIVNSLKDLKKGTEEYRDAIEQANEQAMKLMETNEELRKSASRNREGLITFDKDLLREENQKQQNAVDIAQAQSFSADVNASEKQWRADNEELLKTIGEYIGSNGESVYEYLNKNLGTTLEQFNENTQEYLRTYSGISGRSYEYSEISDKSIEKLVAAYEEHGSSLTLEDIDDIQGISEALRQSIKDNYDNGLLPLIQSNIDLKETNRFYGEEISRSYLARNNDNYNEMGSSERRIMEKLSSDYKDSKEYEKEIEIAKKQVEEMVTFFSNEELAKKYEELFNVEKVSHGMRNAKFTTDSSNPDATFSLNNDEMKERVIDEMARTAVYATNSAFSIANEQMTNDLSDFAKKIKETTGIGGLGGEIREFASGESKTIDIVLTEEEKENIKQAIDEIGANSLNNIDWETLEFGSKESFLNSLQQAINDVDLGSWEEKLQGTFKSMEDAVDSFKEKVQKGDKTFFELREDDDYKEIRENLDLLKSEYPELTAAVQVLNEEWEVGSQKYLEALEMVDDKLFEINQTALEDSVNDSIDKARAALSELTEMDGSIPIDADTTEFENALDELLNKDYELTMHVYYEGIDEFESVDRAFDDIYGKANLIGESFIVAASDLRELNNTFPGILEGMTYLADGTVQLNQQVVTAAIDGAKAEVKADAEAAIEKLKTQQTLLDEKRVIYERMATAARILASDEELTAKESADARAVIDGGLSELRQKNAKYAADSEMNNQKEVADNSQINAGITLDNWSQSWDENLKASGEWAEGAIINQKTVANEGNGAIIKGGIDTNYRGATGQSQEASIINQTQQMLDHNERSSKAWGSMAGQYQNIADAYGKASNDIDGMIAQLQGRGHEIGNAFNNVQAGHGVTNPKPETVKEEKVKEPTTPKEEKVKDPEVLEYLEEERDLYHDINIEIEKKNQKLNRLEKIENGLFGTRLLRNLDKQLKALESQNEAYEKKLALARQEKKELKGQLTSSGVKFEGNTITNYNEAIQSQLNYVNGVIAKYNAMSAEEQEQFKSTVEAVKENYEDFKEKISKYEELVNNTIPDIKDSIQDNIEKEIEISIKKFNMEVELRLNMGEAWRDYLDFKEKVIREIDEDDILGQTQTDYTQYRSYLKRRSSGEIQTLTKKINQDIEEIHKVNREGWSGIFGDNKQTALDTLKEDTESLMKALSEMKDLENEIRDAYPKMIDQMTEAFDKQVSNYEYIDSLINHDMKLIGLLYGDRQYESMNKYYEQVEKNNNQEIDFLKQRAEYAKKMFDAETDPEAKEKWEKEWKDSLDNLNNMVEKAINDLQDKYANSINQVMDSWEKGLTGGQTMSDFADSWDLINKNADYYLDDINSIYELQKLQNKYMEAIDNADGLQNQKDLNKLMEQQIGMLKDKENLTQYDVDRANKVFEIAQKEAAFREAQNNKTQMRLRRDSQGNYRYEYVADEENMKAKAQELADLYNSLYNFDKAAVQKNYDDVVNIVNEYAQKVRNIKLDMTLTEEERQAKLNEINHYYEDMINTRVTENEVMRMNLKQSAFAAMQHEYTLDKELFNQMTDDEYTDFETLTNGTKTFFLDMVNYNIGELERLKDEQEKIVANGMVPLWNNGVQSMIEKFAGSGGFGEQVDAVMGELNRVTGEYEDSLRRLEETAGISFESIKEGHDKNIDAVRELLQENTQLIDQYAQQIQAIQDLIAQLDALIDKYKEVTDAAKEAIKTSIGFQQATMDTAANKASESVTQVSKPNSSNSSSPNLVTKTELQYNPNYKNEWNEATQSWGTDPYKKVTIQTTNGNKEVDEGEKVGVKAGGVVYNSQGKKTTLKEKTPSTRYKVESVSDENQEKGVLLWDYQKGEYRWTSKKHLYGYDTGGYTGDWGTSDGKLAMLHEKEIVLNKQDTKNILNAVNMVRDMSGFLDNLNGSLSDRIGGLLSGLSNIYTGNNNSSSVNTVDQKVTIKADFPNVTNSNEIEKALTNLVNIASQKAFNTQR